MSTKNFKYEIQENITTKNGKIKKKVIKVEPIKNKRIDFADIKKMFEHIAGNGKIPIENICIKGFGDMILTIKSFGSDLKDWMSEDYFINRTYANDAYNSFDRVQFIILQ